MSTVHTKHGPAVLLRVLIDRLDRLDDVYSGCFEGPDGALILLALATGRRSPLNPAQWAGLQRYLLPEAFARPPTSGAPTAEPIGSPGREAALCRRATAGLSLYHPDDNKEIAAAPHPNAKGDRQGRTPGVSRVRRKWRARKTWGGREEIGYFGSREEAEAAVEAARKAA